MNPSEREEYIILYIEEIERQRGSFDKIPSYKIIKKKEDVLPTILNLVRTRMNVKGFKVFVLGTELEVKWK